MPRLNRRSRQETTARPIRVLVAAPQPLHRELVRFFLEEAGCQVVALVASAEDAVCLVTSKRPDAVILHESLATMVGAGFVQRVRQGSSSTKIVVVTPQPERAWSGLFRGADAFLEEWVGIQELGPILQRLCRAGPVAQAVRTEPEPAMLGAAATDGDGGVSPTDPRAIDRFKEWRARWHERLRGAAAASFILILLLLGRGPLHLSATSEGPESAPPMHLTGAYSTLEVLVVSIRAGRSAEAIAETARRLVEERAAALASGADTTRLDSAIEAEVSPLLSKVTPEEAAAIRYVLGDLVSNQGPPPSFEPGPAGGSIPESQPNGKVSPHAVGPPEGITDRPGLANPGPHANSNPGPQRNTKSKDQPDGNAETPSATQDPSSSDPSPDVSPIESPSSTESPSPTDDADPGAQRVRDAEHTQNDSGPSQPDRSTPPVQASAPPVPDAGSGSETILTPAG